MTRNAIALLTICTLCHAQTPAPERLRCEYQVDPIAVDAKAPRLSWQLADTRRGAAQTAYHIIVASSRDAAEALNADVWDSGRVPGWQSVNVAYAGPELLSAEDYYWRVRVWDHDGVPSQFSEPASWEMAFLQPDDWRAKWVAAKAPAGASAPWRHGSWIWHADEMKDGVQVSLRHRFEIPANAVVREATVRCTADDEFELFLGGAKIGEGNTWRRSFEFDVTELLRPGANVLAARVKNQGGPCGFRCSAKIELEGAEPLWLASDAQWRASKDAPERWAAASFDDAAWPAAVVIGPFGSAPWGAPGSGGALRSVMMRRDFELPATATRARVRVCGLGAYELRLNGERVGDELLTPGWTEFAKRLQYQTYDVTRQLRGGTNTLGVITGNGWWKGRIGGGRDRGERSSPRLILQLDIECADGSRQTVTSDPAWRWAPSPITSDDIYDGETYDARLEARGWDAPGFDDARWTPALAVDETRDTLVCQAKPPLRELTEIAPKSVVESSPGVHIFDFGQNLTGWCRLQVRGEAGTEITLRHAEELNPDGSIYTANLRSAQATDRYILSGEGTEEWEPRFTYHGFRYVEVTGLPAEPGADSLIAVAVSSDLKTTGEFECSSDLINGIQHCILWGQWGNMWAVPTDCPQRDERLGWTGDAQVFCNTSCWNMDMARYYTKWMRDIRDGQGAGGEVRDVNPAGGGVASPAWGDACVIVPWTVYRNYGDTRIIDENWDCMTRWVDYITRHSEGNLYERNGYGDWIAVTPSPKHPISAAYYFLDCALLEKMARATGRTAEAEKYAAMSLAIADAFNGKYLDPATGAYPGATQTAQILPLAFGIAHDDSSEASVQVLVDDIVRRGGHLSTGFLGTGYINPVLTTSGHHDLAWALATQTSYPSWGYMVRKGATTIWELWNSDVAGPGMNSRNHFCLGAVGEWFYEALAGTTPETPGFRDILIRPLPVGDLTWVKARYETPYGSVGSRWRLADGNLYLQVTVPPNARATVTVPNFGKDGIRITESDKEVHPGGEGNREELGIVCAGETATGTVFRVGAGTYQFAAHGVGTPPKRDYGLPEPPEKITELSEDFAGETIDAATWEVMALGLESTATSDIAATVGSGELSLQGKTGVNYWAGRTLMSRGGFSVAEGQRLEATVRRVSLSGEGSGARSGFWLWAGPGQYLLFAHDTERGHWSYNIDGRTGTGTELQPDAGGGSHVMKLVHDGHSVRCYLDGDMLADIPVGWSEGIRVGVTGQARQSGDTVNAVFDDLTARMAATQ